MWLIYELLAIPVGRIGTPEDMAVGSAVPGGAIVLVSWNGKEIIVDGGFEHTRTELGPAPRLSSVDNALESVTDYLKCSYEIFDLLGGGRTPPLRAAVSRQRWACRRVRQRRVCGGFAMMSRVVSWCAPHQLACHGLPHIPPGPENPLEFDCRNVLILTFFYPTNSRS